MVGVPLVLVGVLAFSASAAPRMEAQVGTLPDAANEIMQQAPYTTARWLYYVADRKTGEVLLANAPDEMVFAASTAKNFTVASAYSALGPDTRLKTPVVATAPVTDGTVAGDVVLIASGDLALGGRGAWKEGSTTRSTPTRSITCTRTWLPTVRSGCRST